MNLIKISVREARRPKVCGNFRDQTASLFLAALGDSSEKQLLYHRRMQDK